VRKISTYMWINFFIFFFPFLSAIVFFRFFFKDIVAFFISFFVVGIFFIIWDSFFTTKDVWEFNEKHVMKLRIFNLPVEEIIFFITAPFGCIFIFSIMEIFFKDSVFETILLKYLFIFISVCFIIAGIFLRKKIYTFVVFMLTGISTFLFVIAEIFFYKKFIFAMLISYVPFLVFNGILTTLPVVKYNKNHIIGLRIINIPLEDFFYNFIMIGWYFFFFNIFSKIL